MAAYYCGCGAVCHVRDSIFIVVVSVSGVTVNDTIRCVVGGGAVLLVVSVSGIIIDTVGFLTVVVII